MESPRRRGTTNSRPERKLPGSIRRRHGSGIDQNKAHGVISVGLYFAVVSRQLIRNDYGTDNVIVWLLVSLPDVAVTVMV